MSLLTICQAAVNEIGFHALDSVVSNTDTTAQQLYSLAKREGEVLSQEKEWQALKSEHTFDLETATQTYALPADFRYLIPVTTWNRTNRRAVVTPLTSQEWQFHKGWTTLSGLNLRARIRNGLVEFEQTITSSENGETIAFEYMSNYWAKTEAGTAKRAFTLDTDTSRLDEKLLEMGLIWRFKKAKGLDWEGDYQDYVRVKNMISARDGGSRTLKLGSGFSQSIGVNVPESDYG